MKIIFQALDFAKEGMVIAMLLLLGAAYQGKLDWLREQAGIAESDIRYCYEGEPALDGSGRAVCGLHLWVLAALRAGNSPEQELAALLPKLEKQVILCDEIGGGIVPLAREDRVWREAVGRCVRLLAGEAETVLQFTAGLFYPMKGAWTK